MIYPGLKSWWSRLKSWLKGIEGNDISWFKVLMIEIEVMIERDWSHDWSGYELLIDRDWKGLKVRIYPGLKSWFIGIELMIERDWRNDWSGYKLLFNRDWSNDWKGLNVMIDPGLKSWWSRLKSWLKGIEVMIDPGLNSWLIGIEVMI